MRITRSTLRRLIAEESARLLREAAFPEEVEGVYGEAPPEDGGGDGIPKMLHVMYRGFRPVFIVTDVDANPLGEEAEDVTQHPRTARHQGRIDGQWHHQHTRQQVRRSQ